MIGDKAHKDLLVAGWKWDLNRVTYYKPFNTIPEQTLELVGQWPTNTRGVREAIGYGRLNSWNFNITTTLGWKRICVHKNLIDAAKAVIGIGA